MWVKPELHKPSPLWSLVEESSFLELLKKKFSFSSKNADMFRIVLKSDPPYVIAVAPTYDKILKDWTQIQQDLLSKDPGLSRNEMLSFLLSKFQCMYLDLPENKPKDPPNEGEKEDSVALATFQNTFALGEEEKLVASYGASLWDKLPKTGVLYISEHYVCFTSSFVKKSIAIKFKDIKSITKESSTGIQTIKISTATEKYWFIAFKRDEVFNILEQLWTMGMENLLKNTEATMEEMDKHSPSRKFSLALNKNSVESHLGRREFLHNSGDRDPTNRAKSSLHKNKQNRVFQEQFRLPFDEPLVKDLPAKLMKGKKEKKGQLFISKNFLCFQSQTAKIFTVVIPLQEVTSITREVNEDIVLSILTTAHTHAFVVSEKGNNKLVEEIKALWAQCQDSTEPGYIWANHIPPRLGVEILEDMRHFSPLYSIHEESQQEEWYLYLAKYGHAMSLLKTQKLRKLIRKGIPNELRGRIWMVCSGAYAYMLQKKQGYYQALLQQYKETESWAKEEIEKDLHRSLPAHPYYQNEEGISALRRVLTAYSWHNVAVGYCQSMNIVSAMLLLFLPEEQAFYMLCVICEQLAPDYYVKAMIGSIVDQRIFEELMAEKMPAVTKHLRKVGIPLPLVTLPWLLCLFIGYVPMEVALRILDCFFGLEGPTILFAVGLSLFKLNEKAILEEDEGPTIAAKLKESAYDCEQLLLAAFTEYEGLPFQKIEALRNEHRFKAIKEMEQKNKQNVVRELDKSTHFSIEEIEQLESKFASLAHDNYMDYLHFEELFQWYVPWWKHGIIEICRLLDSKMIGAVEFAPVVHVLSIITKGTLAERLEFCFRLFDGDADSFISREEYEYAINCLYSLTQKSAELVNIKTSGEINEDEDVWKEFVSLSTSQVLDKSALDQSFDQADTEGKKRLSFEQFVEATNNPVISLTLGLQ